MRYVLRCAVVPLVLGFLHGTAAANGPPGPLKDWPCAAPFADRLTPTGLWPADLPAPLPAEGEWAADPQARQLVEFIADPANSPRSGARHIEDFVKDNGPLTPALSMLVLTGLVERIDKIRDILIEGIHTQIVRSHILAEVVEENNASLALAMTEPSADPARQPDAIRRARFQNLRSLDDAGEGAEMLCHRYSYDESKARALAAALQQNTR